MTSADTTISMPPATPETARRSGDSCPAIGSGFRVYHEDAGIRIFHGDCREILPTLGDFDLMLTDPPYGIGADSNAHKNGVKCRANGYREYAKTEWDNAPADNALMELVRSKSKRQIIWGGNYFPLPQMAGWLVWDKGQRDFSFADGELAWTNLPMALRIKTYPRGRLLKESGHHPTQKPIDVMLWCIELAGNVETILDPFAGSGTTGRAAKDLGKKCVLIEREERYCEIAAKRLAQDVLPLGIPNV